ncbi:MAG: outer membrane beta-barrel protein [Nitrospira sp.]|nr:outer membrane beta-barrel protein [Nitrospira sp.]
MTLFADLAGAQMQYGGMEDGGPGGQTGVIDPSKVKPTTGSETNWIPSISVQERYDSNVFFVPGRHVEDYVTTIAPKLRVEHKGELVEVTAGGGPTGEIYVNNPGLNYVAGGGSLDLNLSKAVRLLVPGAGLRIRESGRYTPQPFAFLSPEEGNDVSDAFVRGIQSRRANTFTNLGTVQGTYALSPTINLNSTYSDSRMRFGRSFAAPGSTSQSEFVDTTFQTVMSGIAVTVTPQDQVTLSHQYQKGSFDFAGVESGFSTQGAILGWTRQVTQTITAEATGGVVVFDRTQNIQYTGSASVDWKVRETTAHVGYSRAVTPSFFIAGTPLLSQRVGGTVTHHLTEPLSLSVHAFYALNEAVPDSSFLKFESYSVTVGGAYRINRILTVNAGYTRSAFDRTFRGRNSEFDRDVVLLRLVGEWK